jgi:cytochrome c1
MVQWIKNPQAFEPATMMPNLGVSDTEVMAIMAYFESLTRQMAAEAAPGAGVGGNPPAGSSR